MGLDFPESIELDGHGRRIVIAVGRFNGSVTEQLLQGAQTALLQANVGSADITTFYVAGAFEIPLVLAKALATGAYDGGIALGAVIRGGTPHFEYVCEAVTSGCLRVSLDAGKPVAFGVLTCDDQQQAAARVIDGPSNKGREAAQALLESLATLDQL